MAATAFGLYLLGLIIGIVRIDGRAAVRIGLAVIWPAGPAAFLVTAVVLLLASVVAFPLFGLLLAALAVGWRLLV